jgi:uncharacterized glyoxalase superfamily protein PhnB
MHIPPGFTTVFPYIFATSAEAYLTFLELGLSGEITGVHKGPDGTVANAQIRFNDTTVMVSEATGDNPASRATYYIYVADADATMARAVAAGGVQTMEVGDRVYGDRQGGLCDPQGNIWWISQRLAAGSY